MTTQTESLAEKLTQMKFSKFTQKSVLDTEYFGFRLVVKEERKNFFQMEGTLNENLLTSIMMTICDKQCF